ncbi:MAG: glycosyltransferase family 4 protein [Desulfovibrio sp.]|nr:glycosyltransferase family 4 protein [Desulfovibrio sp.]
MKRRIFASLHNFLEGGQVLGRNVASEGFFRALLQEDPFETYAFYLHNPQEMACKLENFADLQALKRGAVHLYPRQNFVSNMRTEGFYCLHLADPVSDQPQAAYLRNHFSKELFPITSIPHSLNYLDYPGHFLRQIWPGATRRDIICATSRAAMAVLQGYFRMLRENYSLPSAWGQPDLRLLPLGVDTQRFRPTTQEERQHARRQLNLSDSTVSCLCHGRLAVDDKMDLLPLLYAVRRVLDEKKAPSLHILVSGRKRVNDNYPEVLTQVAKSLHIPLTIIIDPNAEKMQQLLHCADLFLSLSDNVQETFGLTLLEAGASGLASITSDWDGYRDIVEDGASGLLVPTLAPKSTPYLNTLAYGLPENIHELLRAQQTVIDVPYLAQAISRLARDQGLRTAMGAKARQRVTSFYDWSVIIKRWLQILEEAYACPISAEEGARLALAEHPAFLNFAELFAQHPSFCPDFTEFGQCQVVLSTRGRQVLQKQAVTVTWNNLDIYLRNLNIRKLLTLARHPIALTSLLHKLCAQEIPKESGQFAVLWALKHDLLELIQVPFASTI